MNTEFGFIGWCKDEENNHDKGWGYFLRPDPAYEEQKKKWGWAPEGRNCVVFWGRRGKAMQFKADKTGDALNRLARSKYTKGYDRINTEKLLEIWPTFNEEMEMKLSFEILVGNVK